MALMANPDGSLAVGADNALIIAPTQQEFEDCCCGEPSVPCTDCFVVNQDSVTVTTNCGGCDFPCETADGVYTYTTKGGICWWRWTGPSNYYGEYEYFWDFLVTFTPGTGLWAAQLELAGGPGMPVLTKYYSANVSGLSCNKTTGKLEGTIVIPGLNEDADCSSGSATVVF